MSKRLYRSILENMNSVSLIEDGEGIEYDTPLAFGDEDEKEEEIAMPNTLDPFKESFKRIDALISEITYKDYKSDPNTSMKQKLNNNIKEIYKSVINAEKLINHASKLKHEINADQTIFFKETFNKFQKISERMGRLQTKLREFSK